MKGVVLAGGLGTRLRPLTHITNKHLLPVYDRPMVFYPIQTLISFGINEIIVVCGEEYTDHFKNVISKIEEFDGIKFHFAMQEGNGGIADALACAERFVKDDNCTVILGDNIFGPIDPKPIKEFEGGACVFVKEVADPERFGVLVEKNGRFEIVEKPKERVSEKAIVGLYVYDRKVFEIVRSLVPSKRGELEITDVNNAYIKQGNCVATNIFCYWKDAGTFDSLIEVSNWIKKKK